MTMTMITLNVGGTMFVTTKKTLISRSQFFRNIFKSLDDAKIDIYDINHSIDHINSIINTNTIIVYHSITNERIIFVDRDPQAFKHILSYLRDMSYSIPYDYMSDAEFFIVENHQKMEYIDSNNELLSNLNENLSNINDNLKNLNNIASDLNDLSENLKDFVRWSMR